MMDIPTILFAVGAIGAIVTWAVHMIYAIQIVSTLNTSDPKPACASLETRRAHAITFYVAFGFSALFFSIKYLRGNAYI